MTSIRTTSHVGEEPVLVGSKTIGWLVRLNGGYRYNAANGGTGCATTKGRAIEALMALAGA